MKILNKEDVGKYTLYTLLLDNNTTTTVNVVNDARDEKEIMKDIRILTKNTVGEPFVGTTSVEDYVFEDSKPTLMYVDFVDLTGEVYDQYAELMEVPIIFSVDSEVARIEDGQLIEDTVENDVSYFIVAKCGDLEERQERIIFAPSIQKPDEVDLLKKRIEVLSQENENKSLILQELILKVYADDPTTI